MSTVIDQARAIAGTDRDAMSVDLQSHVATFERRAETGHDRAAFAFARVVVKLAAREGIEAEVEEPSRTVPELKAEIASRNEGRGDDDLIVVPSRAAKADLEQLLADDDARQA